MCVSKKSLLHLSSILILLLLVSCNSKPIEYNEEEMKTVKALPDTHIDFIVSFYPGAVKANQRILEQREQIIECKSDYPAAVKRSRKLKRLNRLAAEYRLTDSLFTENLTKDEFLSRIDDLLYRVNIIPEKLVMAQAIIESGWGSSKFSKSINNYFGIHCHTPGCGEPPSAVKNPKFWVKSFPTIEACVEEYIWLLNTGFAFEDLREIRSALIKKNKTPNAMELAKGLERYSEKGNDYITLVQSIIKNYLPNDLNAFVDYHQSVASL